MNGMACHRPAMLALPITSSWLMTSSSTTALWNNVRWLVLFMLALPIGLAMALFLNQVVFGIRLIKSLFFFPFVISQVVIGLIFTVL